MWSEELLLWRSGTFDVELRSKKSKKSKMND